MFAELFSSDLIVVLASEQSITPWEEDASVSQCPLCAQVTSSVPFHTATLTFNPVQCFLPPHNKPKTSLSSLRTRRLFPARQASSKTRNLLPPLRRRSQDRGDRRSKRRRGLRRQKANKQHNWACAGEESREGYRCGGGEVLEGSEDLSGLFSGAVVRLYMYFLRP